MDIEAGERLCSSASVKIRLLAPTGAIAVLIAVIGCTTVSETTNQSETIKRDSLRSIASEARYIFDDQPERVTYPNKWTVLKNIAYDEQYAQPAWVAYSLKGAPTFQFNNKARDGYDTDKRTVIRVGNRDHPAGYHRGHMAPNKGISLFYGDTAQDETFLMTNMLPQRGGLNTGPWETVENAEYSKWAGANQQIWILCGPVYTEKNTDPIIPKKRVGPKRVSIPDGCFKIIVRRAGNGEVSSLAFIMPQENASGNPPAKFLKSIRHIEERTGLNFFSSLPKAKQDAIELQAAVAMWQ